MSLFAKRDNTARELSISGTGVLLTAALWLTSSVPLIWVVVRYWIFEP